MQVLSNEHRPQAVADSRDDQARPRRFLAILCLATLTIWLLPLALMRLPHFMRWSGTYYGPMLEYSFTASRTDADVVIFGDSSALFGVDPLLITAESGLRAINLPNTISSLPFTNDMSLRRYLSRNRPPRLIVFYFAPWNLNYSNEESQEMYEGEEMLARHGSTRQVAAFIVSHPSEAAMFPFRFYAANSLTVFLSHLKSWHEQPAIAKAMGHATLTLPGSKLLKTSCQLPAKILHASHVDSALDLEQRYGSGQSKVLFYMAPVPRCGNAAGLEAVPFAKLGAAPPQLLNPGYYDDDGYFIHLDGRGVTQATDNLVAAIRSALDDTDLNRDPMPAKLLAPIPMVSRTP